MTEEVQIEDKKKVEQKVVPKRRFQEFSDDWKSQPIGNHINLLSGFAFKGDDISEEKTGIPILRGINITEGFIRHSSDIDRYYDGSLDKLKKYLLKEGDLVLGMDGSKVGKNVAIISKEDSNSLLIQRVARLRPNQNASIQFVYHHIFSPRFHRYVDIVNTSSGIPHISAQQIKDFKIFFPSLPEQQKIASFLSAIDKKIQQLTRKKALLETYKKGVMQKLFSQEIRFRDEDGKDFPEWKEKKLGEICDVRDGTHESPKYMDQGYPLITSKNLMADGSIDFVNINLISEVDFDNFNKRSLVERGDIIFGMIGTIGNPVIVRNDGFAIKNVALIKEKDDLKNSFLIHYLKSFLILQQFHKQNTGGTQKFIALGTIRSLEISVPSKNEQQKIADFLAAIDNKIEAVSQQVEKTQTFKKGLLQQMFV